jgi:MarR family transcriptional regulator, organic hydroperoxide resistance regulator
VLNYAEPMRETAGPTVRAPGGETVAGEIVDLVWQLVAQMHQHFHTRIAELGLSPPQAMALRGLDPDQPVPMGALACKLRCDASNVTGIVDRLEAKQLVERRVAAGDRRVKTLVFTAKGRAVRRRLEAALLDESPPVARLTPAEQRVFRELLRRVVTPL